MIDSLVTDVVGIGGVGWLLYAAFAVVLVVWWVRRGMRKDDELYERRLLLLAQREDLRKTDQEAYAAARPRLGVVREAGREEV